MRDAFVYSELLFARGYLVAPGALPASCDPAVREVLSRWDTLPFGGLTVYHDPALPAHQSAGKEASILMLGMAVDPFTPLADEPSIVDRMRELFEASDERFLDYLDRVTGRFVLLLEGGGRLKLIQDATGTRTAFYDISSSEPTLSSHCSLIAGLRGYRTSPDAAAFIDDKAYGRLTSYLPGLLTPYDEVRILAPNTWLDVGRRAVERVYPREPLGKRLSPADVAEELSRTCKTQMEQFAARADLLIGLSGGIDSRITLCSLPGCAEGTVCYTHLMTPSCEREAQIARRLCELTGIRHVGLPVELKLAGPLEEAFLETWRANTAWMRGTQAGFLCGALIKAIPVKPDSLHVLSMASGPGKAFYRKKARLFLPDSIRPETLATYYPVRSSRPYSVSAFREYVSVMEFAEDKTLDFDIYDLFYWEHRCGCWQSFVIMGFDMAAETLLPFNNRRMIEQTMKVLLRDRLENRVQIELASRLMPEARSVPLEGELVPRYRREPKALARYFKFGYESFRDTRRARGARGLR